MAESSIEWTDATSSEKADVLKAQPLSGDVFQAAPGGNHPLVYVAVALGAIARPARRENVSGSRSASLRNWNDVIPSVCRRVAVSAQAIEQFAQKLLALWWNSINSAFSFARVLLSSVTEIGVVGVVLSHIGIAARAAIPRPNRRLQLPCLAACAPLHSGASHDVAFDAPRPPWRGAAAVHAKGGTARAARAVRSEVCGCTPMLTPMAPLLAGRCPT